MPILQTLFSKAGYQIFTCTVPYLYCSLDRCFLFREVRSCSLHIQSVDHIQKCGEDIHYNYLQLPLVGICTVQNWDHTIHLDTHKLEVQY